jgi:hypothetical protein
MIVERFGALWLADPPFDNAFAPTDLIIKIARRCGGALT